MSKVSLRRWTAPVDKSKLPSQYPDGNLEIAEEQSPVMNPDMNPDQGYHPIIANPEGVDLLTLTPVASPAASNYFYTNKLAWAAQYADGSIITQFHEGEEQSVDNLPRENLRRFSVISSDGKVLASLDLKPGQMFFYRKRTVMRPGHDVIEAIHLFGWRLDMGHGVKDIVSILFVYESDLHIECGGFHHPLRAARPQEWRYPINWHEADLVKVT